jgi:hypothetical protein
VSHFSPVPPGERKYAPNYRQELQHLEAQLVRVSGRVKEFRDHPERSDLRSLLLVNLIITPVSGGRSIKLSHLWVLEKHVRRTGIEPKQGRRATFVGAVYAYFRLGGKSKQRGLLGSHDFSILPMHRDQIETFKPGIKQRYEIEDETDGGGAPRGQEGAGRVGEGAAV